MLFRGLQLHWLCICVRLCSATIPFEFGSIAYIITESWVPLSTGSTVSSPSSSSSGNVMSSLSSLTPSAFERDIGPQSIANPLYCWALITPSSVSPWSSLTLPILFKGGWSSHKSYCVATNVRLLLILSLIVLVLLLLLISKASWSISSSSISSFSISDPNIRLCPQRFWPDSQNRWGQSRCCHFSSDWMTCRQLLRPWTRRNRNQRGQSLETTYCIFTVVHWPK